MNPSFERMAEAAEETESVEKSKDVGTKLELPDDSGDMQYKSELPDDSGESMPEKKLSPEEIAQKQDEVILSVENGDTPLESDTEKGNYGEMKVDQDLRKKGYQRISLDAIISIKDKGHQGIDGVYYNPDGKPPYLIVDAKYNTAQLEKSTQDGPQMSQNWIDKRLDASVGKAKADDIRMAHLRGDVGCYVGRVAEGGNLNAPVSYEQVDENGKVVEKDVTINAA